MVYFTVDPPRHNFDKKYGAMTGSDLAPAVSEITSAFSNFDAAAANGIIDKTNVTHIPTADKDVGKVTPPLLNRGRAGPILEEGSFTRPLPRYYVNGEFGRHLAALAHDKKGNSAKETLPEDHKKEEKQR